MFNAPASVLSAGETAEIAAFALTLADKAAAVTLPLFRTGAAIDNKLEDGFFDPVTAADRDAETAIRDAIKAAYPAHGLFGEEHGREEGTSPFTWVLDPIDGTRSFISGVPLWGTLIALNDGLYPRVGLMSQPYLDETYLGTGAEAWLYRHGQKSTLKTRPCPGLSHAILGATDPAIFAPGAEWDAFEKVSETARLRRYGGDCYFYCLLAAGQIDLVVEAALNPYDIQALIPVVEGAGGIITSWEGGDPQEGGRIIAAGDARVHEEALAVLSKV
ncbi:histidinol-phosphatase [Tepidicaulis sp. LMO-SS28]|uniref:histidinol-phosphatase n=1 Tax=Tepidicaulis sp. LMO-SS28 TaxID=3447455 RepID=UPI003EE42289